MPRLMVELRDGSESASIKDMIGALQNAGADPVRGYEPVVMTATADLPQSVIVTVDVPDLETQRRIEDLPCVVQVFGDVQIGPFSP